MALTKIKNFCNFELRYLCCVKKNYAGTRWSSKYFLTTPIFYVNADPHVGHLYTALLGDAAARFHKMKNPGAEVKFMVGTDEHGLKISQSAQKLNLDVKLFCDNVSQKYRELFNLFLIEADDFIRTTQERHIQTVTHFWRELDNKGHIYKDKYSGWYCIPDETFISEIYLDSETNEEGIRYTIEGKKPTEYVTEVNYKFTLSKFQDDLLHWLGSGEIVKPKVFQSILHKYIQTDEIMQDISISRPIERVPWGIPVPEDPSQTIYVWLDALSCYLCTNGYPHSSFKWPPDLQIIGKDILKFHGIYWPAFLIAAGLEPPKCILCHSHWLKDDEKISKSKGNVINPFDEAKLYTSDGFRYFLLSKGVPHSDGNITDVKITDYLNSELGDTLGNLLSRCTGKLINPEQIFPSFFDYHDNHSSSNVNNLMDSLKELPEEVETSFEEFNYYRGIEKIISTLHLANKFFTDEKPWELCKDDKKRDHLNFVLCLTMESLRVSGILLQPIIPNVANNLLNKLSIPKTRRTLSDITPFIWESSEKGTVTNLLSEKVLLFPKVKKVKNVG